MVDAVAPTTPEQSAAAAKLDTIIDKALGYNVDVKINKGMNVKVFKEGASEGIIEVVVKNARFAESAEEADKAAGIVKKELHMIADLRDHAIFLSPHEYLGFGASEIKFFQDLAIKSGIPMEGVDLSKTVVTSNEFSQNQKPDHASQLVDSPGSQTIRINIPTNPKNLEAAETLAQKVAKDIESRLPEIKEGMIARMLGKNYRTATPEQLEHMKKHEFKVSTQQQGNWTSVFIEIRSPEQVHAREHPEEKTDPATLTKTNMLTQIENADSRAKIAARAALFSGPDLRKPASYYTEIAGTQDVKNAVGKMLHYVVQKNPDMKKRAESLMKENFFLSNEQWNLPPEQQSTFKQNVSASVKPGTDELKITIRVPVSKTEEVIKHLAALHTKAPLLENSVNAALAASVAPDAANAAIAANTPEAAAAGAVAACPPGEIAVAGAAAVEGQGAEAEAGCVAPEKPPVAIGNNVVHPKQPTPLTPRLAQDFVKKVQSGEIAL